MANGLLGAALWLARETFCVVYEAPLVKCLAVLRGCVITKCDDTVRKPHKRGQGA